MRDKLRMAALRLPWYAAEYGQANIGLYAASGAYYLFFSLGPLVVLLLGLLPYLPFSQQQLQDGLLDLLGYAPAPVQELVEDCPVTAKIRSGWDADSICAVEACMRLENAGVHAITVHGRTRSQQYSGTADWNIIHSCARSVRIPIIGNGDLRKPEDILRERDKGIVAGVMIGRAAMSSPWIFDRARHLLDTGELLPEPTPQEKLDLTLHCVRSTLDSGHYGDEHTTMRALRARILSLTKGIPGTKERRPALARVSSWIELQEILRSLG